MAMISYYLANFSLLFDIDGPISDGFASLWLQAYFSLLFIFFHLLVMFVLFWFII